jgi:hypothetical protein
LTLFIDDWVRKTFALHVNEFNLEYVFQGTSGKEMGRTGEDGAVARHDVGGFVVSGTSRHLVGLGGNSQQRQQSKTQELNKESHVFDPLKLMILRLFVFADCCSISLERAFNQEKLIDSLERGG